MRSLRACVPRLKRRFAGHKGLFSVCPSNCCKFTKHSKIGRFKLVLAPHRHRPPRAPDETNILPPSWCLANVASGTNCTKPHEDWVRNTVFIVFAGIEVRFFPDVFLWKHVFHYLQLLGSVATSCKLFFLKYSQIVLSPYSRYWYAWANRVSSNEE